MEISIIIPVYNMENYLNRCLDSLLRQTFQNFELICIDDGSVDTSLEILQSYQDQFEYFTIITQENQGVSAARNKGMKAAKGNYIHFIDSDDWIETDALEKAYCFLHKNKCDIVCFDTYIVRGDRKKYKPRFVENKFFYDQDGLHAILTDTIDNSVCNKIFKKSLCENIFFPIGRRYEDVATTYKFFIQAQRVGFLAKPLYNYFKRNDSFIGKSFNFQDRFHNFLAYKDQLTYAENNTLSCIDECKKNLLEVSTATLSAYYKDESACDCKDFQQIENFLISEKNTKIKLRFKQSILLWTFYNCKSVNKMYAKFFSFLRKY